MASLFKEGFLLLFTFFIFVTIYLILNNLGYPSIISWLFIVSNTIIMIVSIFLVLEYRERYIEKENKLFWTIALGIFILAGIFLQFIFLLESRLYTPATIGVAGTLTTISFTYFLMAKELFETRSTTEFK